MRVIFFGTSEFAVPSLEQLVMHQHTVLSCVTQPDRPQGRGLEREPSPVKRTALQLGLPLSQPERLRVEDFRALQPDLGVVAAYGQLIPQALLVLPPHGMVGVHPSLLPKYRGAAPVAWALLNGETTTGITIFRLNERMDAGAILRRQTVTIEPEEDTETLTHRLAQRGADALVRSLEALAAGHAIFETQDDSQATLAPKLTKAQGQIDWSQPAQHIERLVRAMAPWPGATTQWRGGLLRVWKASVAESSATRASDIVPGATTQVTHDAILVATGAGMLALKELQPPGRRRMIVQEFLAGHPVHVGERFGVTRDT